MLLVVSMRVKRSFSLENGLILVLGVYLMPEFDNIRKLHGVIFVRSTIHLDFVYCYFYFISRGLYRDGVFRFLMELPLEYNATRAPPIIHFIPPIFHPLIHPEVSPFLFNSCSIFVHRRDSSTCRWLIPR
jgi:hypothetical protein